MFRILWSIFRQNTYFIIGLIIGLGLSILLIPLVETDCIGGASRRVRPRIHSHKSDDYEPRINLAAKPKMALKSGDTLVRPRFYTTELGIKEKLFVGVLTTPQSIGTLGLAMNKTTAHLVDKIMYFIDAPSAQKINVSSLKLPGIVGFTDTRDVLKPFHLIKYIADNFLEDYDYFFITRDSTYIQARSLYEFAKKISVSEDVYCGNPSATDKASKHCSLGKYLLIYFIVGSIVHCYIYFKERLNMF